MSVSILDILQHKPIVQVLVEHLDMWDICCLSGVCQFIRFVSLRNFAIEKTIQRVQEFVNKHFRLNSQTFNCIKCGCKFDTKTLFMSYAFYNGIAICHDCFLFRMHSDSIIGALEKRGFYLDTYAQTLFYANNSHSKERFEYWITHKIPVYYGAHVAAYLWAVPISAVKFKITKRIKIE